MSRLLAGLRVPLVQAPMVGCSSPELVAAVSNAGALGSLACGSLTPQAIVDEAASVRRLLDGMIRTFAINLFVLHSEETPRQVDVPPDSVLRIQALLSAFYKELGADPAGNPFPSVPLAPVFEDQLAAVAVARPTVASFTFGVLRRSQIEMLHSHDILVCGTATTVQEARAWEEAGADMVCVQGSEAGGHRGTFLHAQPCGALQSQTSSVVRDVRHALIGTLALVPQVVDAVRIPVIAAGGIVDGRGLAAALCLGASAGEMGTAFLNCRELQTVVPRPWRNEIANVAHATSDRTVLTSSFTGRFARGFENRYIRGMEKVKASAPRADLVPDYPVMNAATQHLRRESAALGRPDYMSMWAGQGAPLVARKYASDLGAAAIVDFVAAECNRTLEEARARAPQGKSW